MSLHCTRCGAQRELEETRCLDCGNSSFSEPVHAQAQAETIHAGSNVNGGEIADTEKGPLCPMCQQPTSGMQFEQVINQQYIRYYPCMHVRAVNSLQ